MYPTSLGGIEGGHKSPLLHFVLKTFYKHFAAARLFSIFAVDPDQFLCNKLKHISKVPDNTIFHFVHIDFAAKQIFH